MNTIKILLLAAALSVPFAGQLYAQQPAGAQQNVRIDYTVVEPSLAVYAEGINAGDPAAARKFLEDTGAISRAENINGSTLKIQALALKDLEALMNQDWKAEQHNTLYKALVNRIGKDKVLTLSGVGPQPEKLLPWLQKYIARYSDPEKGAAGLYAVKQAIREWVTVFGQNESRGFEWDGVPLNITKAQWSNMSLIERNATLKKIGMHMARLGDYSYLAYSEETTEAISVQREQAIRIKSAMESDLLTPQQKQELANARTLSDQAYMLNKFFDGTNVKHSDDLRLGINSSRASTPDETFSASNRQLMASMLGSSISAELRGTTAGQRVLDGGLKIDIGYCDKGYSELRADGTIVLDEETIQQYMRLKGYTAASVMSDKKQLAEIAKYMSPAVVYEAAHRDQAKWAKKNRAYKPHTQEDEIDAMSQEALYTAEKMQKDESFSGIFTSVEKYSKYAAKRVENASTYTQGKKMFADNVRMGCQELPSLSSAEANTINGINEELARRAKLTAEQRAEEYTFITYDEAVIMTPDQILSAVRDIEEGALVKLLNSLKDNSYETYNRNSVAQTRTSYNNMMAAAGKKTERTSRREFVPVP